MLLLACPRLQPVPDTIHPHRVLGGEVRAQSRAGRTAQASRVHTWLGHADDLGVRDPRHHRLDEAIDRLPWTRSEEHTSELQSLMRISYAVFCLKKKKKKQTET